VPAVLYSRPVQRERMANLERASYLVISDEPDPDVEWVPVPLELPIYDPLPRRPPSPVDGDRNPESDGERGSRVIVIDLT
jgi:hypothetical protein